MRIAREKDHEVLYPETGEERILRKEQEKQVADGRMDFYGASIAISPKVRGAFKIKAPKVKRMRTFHANTDSKAWKDYQEGKISFSEMKRLLKLN